MAGSDVACEVFKFLDPDIKFVRVIKDGAKFKSGEVLFKITGKLSAILTGERTALNFLQHLSGIATLTNKFVEKIAGTSAKILDTRKTTPGLRELEKHAVKCGGGENHRMGLWNMILIKDNHIKVVGGIREVISKIIPQNAGQKSRIEIEIKDLGELKEALQYPIDRVMLDNMGIPQIKEAVKIVKSRIPNTEHRTPKIEVSGGVNLNNVREIAETGIDYISVGALTHSAPAIDMSLEIAD